MSMVVWEEKMDNSKTRKKRTLASSTRSQSARAASSRGIPSRKSLSDQVAERISQEYILNGHVLPGELLPREADLCEHYDVSRVTVRAALRSLWDHGLISVRNGVGAIVLPNAKEVRHGLDRLASIDTFAREKAKVVENRYMEILKVGADAKDSEKLQIPVNAPVFRIRLLKVFDGKPAAWIVDTIPEATIDESILRSKFKGSVLDVLLLSGNYKIEYADSEVRPCLAKGELAERLVGDEDGLLLHLDTVVMSAEGNPVLWGKIWLDPTSFRFSFSRRRFR